MIDRRGLLKTAALVYLALTVVALGVAWGAGVDLRPLLRFNWTAAALGVAAVVPMSLVFFVAPDLKDKVVDLLGPALAECRFFDLLLLAALAGVAEELVFRGAIEGWLQRYDIVVAMIVTNILFGLMHPITLVYFLIAAGFGFYFSVLANLGAERNLTAPIVAHTVYDFLGFLLVARDYRKTPVRFEVVSRPAFEPVVEPSPEESVAGTGSGQAETKAEPTAD
ncbi:hypothetical protein AYO47_06935 [Planctomyces sp. SCGC AG-212-M04]|nr:hypothetical protein AYO47_06935 [Planctomyces sp. SCGC AG-212-M04]